MDLPVVELASAHGRCVAVCVDRDARTPAASAPAVSLDDALAALHPDEQRLAAALAPARRRDWIAGRAALRAALHRVDAGVATAVGAIVSDDRGAPRLPAAWVGSISHKRGLAVALAAAADGWTLGIDLEPDAAPRIDIARRVMTPAEAAALDARGPSAAERGLAVMRCFAIKEAVYKAIDPHLRRYVGFLEVEVWPDDDGAATVTSALPVHVEAAWQREGGLLICSARARPR